jgi:hypothetical protein
MSKNILNSQQKETLSVREEIKDECLSLVDQFTMHGLPNVFRARNAFMKITWFTLFLASTGVCTWLTVKAILDYLNYEVVTKIRVQSEIPVQLPAITICNSNPFMEEQALTGIELLYKDDTLLNITNYPVSIQKYLMLSLIQVANLTQTEKSEIGFTLEKFVIRCQFGTNNCESTDWIWYYDFTFGNCFTFNSGRMMNGTKVPLRKIRQTGKYFGLEVELFAGNPSNFYSLSKDYGVHVFIHNQSQPINPYSPLTFPTGFASNIAISKVVNSRLEYPYSECKEDFGKFDSELYLFLTKSNRIYSQSDCFYVCIQKKLALACQCSYTWFPNLYDLQPCLDKIQSECVRKVVINMIDNLKESCKNYCPLECNTITYTTAITSNRYPTQSYANVLLDKYDLKQRFNSTRNVTYEELKDNVLALNFYLDSFDYTEIIEKPSQTVTDMISTCGGILLFL